MTKDINEEVDIASRSITVQSAPDPEYYYFFMRHGVIIEVAKFPGGKAAYDYCQKRYGNTAVACLMLGQQDPAAEYEHVIAPGSVLTEKPQ